LSVASVRVQSRILVGGSTAVETGSNGGTFGWMSPEELTATKGGQDSFESRLSGDIHTAGSIMFFILTGGLHAYGPRTQTVETVNGEWFTQQNNIVNGRYELRPLFASGQYMTCVADLFMRMSCKEPTARIKISAVTSHPALWDSETKLRKITDWHKSWERGSLALERRLSVHSRLVKRLLGDRPEGWLAALPPVVRVTSTHI
jgi:serine/threonine protein kinase